MKKVWFFYFLICLAGCVPTFADRLSTLRPGMSKTEVDRILMDRGKWMGTINTKDGINKVWGYPSSSYGPQSAFNSQRFKRYYFFFDGDTFVKYTDSYDPFEVDIGRGNPIRMSLPPKQTDGVGGRAIPGRGPRREMLTDEEERNQ
jgi:hypothetical protein